jgi:hypothetical protein
MSDLRKEIERVVKDCQTCHPKYRTDERLINALADLFEERIKAERLDAYDKCQLDAEQRTKILRKIEDFNNSPDQHLCPDHKGKGYGSNDECILCNALRRGWFDGDKFERKIEPLRKVSDRFLMNEMVEGERSWIIMQAIKSVIEGGEK